MRTIPSLILFVLLCGCNQEVIESLTPCTFPEGTEYTEVSSLSEDSSSDEEESIDYCELPAQISETHMAFNIELYDFDITSEEKMIDALTRLKWVVNSEEFKNRVLSHEYNGELKFADNNGLTNEEIYEVLMNGAETLNNIIDHEIDLPITLYYEESSTSGYTYSYEEGIWINDYFYADNSPAKVANTVYHEWTHKLGFEHDFYSTTKRPYSVPYGVGSIIQELIEEL